ncbi:hypothetical protein acdb102_14170 [Acidothermaceae bacterium B102]|nr:hypothetical protein acdb102_14170 [Acidothermaceae bacterium B102]
MSETPQPADALIDLDQLRASAAINATPMTIGSSDGRYLAVNEAFALLTGRSVDELVGLPFAAITVPEDHQTGIVVLAEATASGTPGLTFDKRYIRPDGGIIHARLSTTIVRGPQNQVLYFVTQVTDLTELREAQELSQRNEERLRRVITSATDAYVSIDQHRHVRDWNPAAVQMFGWTREEALDTDLAELIIPPDLREAHRQGVDRYLRGEGAHYVGKTVELPAVRRDGVTIPIDLTLWAATESDGEETFHAFLRDASGRAEAAEQARRHALVLEALTDGVFLTDPSGMVIDTNPAGERLFGRTRDELLGAAPSQLLDDRPDMVERVTDAVAEHGSWFGDVGFTRPDGQRRVSEALIKALPGSNGELQGYLAVHRDVTQDRQAEARLTEAEARWRLVFDSAPIGIALVALDGSWLAINAALSHIIGYSHEELTDKRFQDITHPDDLAADLALLHQLHDGVITTYQLDKRYLHADGHVVWVSLTATLLRDGDGQPLHYIAEVEDITDRRAAAKSLVESEARYRLLAENSSDVISHSGPDGTLLYVSPSYERVFGLEPDHRLGGAMGADAHPDDLAAIRETWKAVISGTPTRVTFRGRRGDGSWVWLESVSEPMRDAETGAIVGVQTATRDITERRAAEAELERMALSDALTGLANRTLLTDRLHQAQQRLRRDPGHVALLMLDLDRFKLVNDTLGHSVGDALLIEVARRLQRCARPTDTVSRLGGDEFILLLDRLSDFAHAEQIAERILEALRAPMVLANLEPMEIRGSIGIAVSSDPDHPADSLYREADLALYRAKDQGRDRYSLFDAGLRRKVIAQVKAERQLRRALAEDRLHLFYQPIIRLADDQVSGSEALVRLQDPDSTELVLPGAFIEAAEESGLIADLDQWVLGRAIEHLAAIGTVDGLGGTVAINVSPRSMVDSRFADRVAEALATRQIDPRRLLIEVTERTLMDTSGSAVRSLNLLRELGVRVGLDDFGTGYSSLGYLQQLPLDFLKIDRSFIGSLADSSRARATVEALTVLAHAHGLSVTAEGVETELQLTAVREIGCDYAQGYLTGRPSPA